jgi:hypothetical protein
MTRIPHTYLQFWNKWQAPADIDPSDVIESMGADFDPQTHRFIKPRVEGVYAFDRIWDSNANFMETMVKTAYVRFRDKGYLGSIESPLEDAGAELGGITRNSFYTLQAMQQAHTITFDPDQFNVIPDWESPNECIDYATHARLPFDCIFLDCELPTRKPRPTESEVTNVRYQILGGLASVEDGALIIIPFGTILNEEDERVLRIVEKRNDGTERIKQSWSGSNLEHLPLGAVVFNLRAESDPHRTDQVFDTSLPMNTWESESLGFPFKIWDLDLAWSIKHGKLEDDSGFSPNEYDSKGPSPVRTILIPPDPGQMTPGKVLGMASALFVGASEILKCLYFLDTPNIELVDAPLTRQVRRQAERSGAKISKTIFVQHSTKRYDRDDAEGEHVEFSHRFEVRGHWKCYPEGTRMADARPDLLRYVPGRGMCRKIWTPPFVKGPEDKPLVIKTRRLREDSETTA